MAIDLRPRPNQAMILLSQVVDRASNFLNQLGQQKFKLEIAKLQQQKQRLDELNRLVINRQEDINAMKQKFASATGLLNKLEESGSKDAKAIAKKYKDSLAGDIDAAMDTLKQLEQERTSILTATSEYARGLMEAGNLFLNAAGKDKDKISLSAKEEQDLYESIKDTNPFYQAAVKSVAEKFKLGTEKRKAAQDRLKMEKQGLKLRKLNTALAIARFLREGEGDGGAGGTAGVENYIKGLVGSVSQAAKAVNNIFQQSDEIKKKGDVFRPITQPPTTAKDLTTTMNEVAVNIADIAREYKGDLPDEIKQYVDEYENLLKGKQKEGGSPSKIVSRKLELARKITESISKNRAIVKDIDFPGWNILKPGKDEKQEETYVNALLDLYTKASNAQKDILYITEIGVGGSTDINRALEFMRGFTTEIKPMRKEHIPPEFRINRNMTRNVKKVDIGDLVGGQGDVISEWLDVLGAAKDASGLTGLFKSAASFLYGRTGPTAGTPAAAYNLFLAQKLPNIPLLIKRIFSGPDTTNNSRR